MGENYQPDRATYMSRTYAGPLDEKKRGIKQSLGYCCPRLGTMECLDCPYADGCAREGCDFQCESCEDAPACACSRQGWQRRNGNGSEASVP